jgi:hypothetical protein
MCHLQIIWQLRRDTSSPEVGTSCAKLKGTASEVAVIIQHSNGVCPPGEHPPPIHHSLATVDLSGQLSLTLSISLSLCLAKEGFSLGGKTPSPLQLLRQVTREIRGQPGTYTGLPMLHGQS